MFVFSNLALAKRKVPAIIWCFARRTRWASSNRIDVSVSAVRYRAFVFAAPPYFVAGNPPTKHRGAVSVGSVCPPAATPQKFFRPFEGVSCSGVLWTRTRANRQVAEE